MNNRSKPLALAAILCVCGCTKDEPLAAPVAPAPPVATHEVEPAAPPVAPAITTAEQIQVPALAVSDAPADVAKGKQLFVDRGCATCHLSLAGVKAVGPDLVGVTARRPLVYVERMILRPDVMIRTDATARALFAQYSAPMTNQRIDPVKELPFLVAYLKSLGK